LSGFGLWQGRFDDSDFSGATLTAIDIQGGSFRNANFERARMEKAHISNVSFAGASFAGASLAGARLIGADLRQARLTGTNLEGLCFDAKTVWPEGFDPAAAGAKGTCR
jgi:uncharacterized protein YjbI with pentapeptide repeats